MPVKLAEDVAASGVPHSKKEKKKNTKACHLFRIASTLFWL